MAFSGGLRQKSGFPFPSRSVSCAAGGTGNRFGAENGGLPGFRISSRQREHIGKTGHGRVDPVVGDILDNRQPGPQFVQLMKG